MPSLKKDRTGREPSLFGELDEEPPVLTEVDLRSRPLADRMRPRTLDEFVGQEKIVGSGRALRRMIESDRLQSLIFMVAPGKSYTIPIALSWFFG